MGANFFKSRRESLGLTQQQVADAAGIKVPAVSAWERDLTAPDLDHVTALAGVYQTTEARILKEIAALRAAQREKRTAAVA